MKKDVYYFPHFCHARSDRRIRRILKDFKHEGYSVYYQVLEVLREQTDFKYCLEDLDLLVDDLKTTDIVINSLIMNYDLFENDGVFFWSNDLIESLQPYLRMKEQRINASKKGVEARRKKREQKALEQPTGNRPVTDRLTEIEPTGKPTANQSKVKESKVKESKVKESKENESAFSFYCFINYEGIIKKITKEFYLDRFQPNKQGMQFRYSHVKDEDSFIKQLENFLAEKNTIEFENEKHFHNTFNSYLRTNQPKETDTTVNSKQVYDENNPNPNWEYGVGSAHYPEEERKAYRKWCKKISDEQRSKKTFKELYG